MPLSITVSSEFRGKSPVGHRRRSTVVVDTTLFSDLRVSRRLPTLSFVIVVVLLLYVHGHVETVGSTNHTIPGQA